MIRASIRRPVAVAMTYACVAALGAFSWKNIPIELYPDVQLPRLTVSASWPGASPETVEAFLTSPLESIISQVQGQENIISDSREGSASISIEFERDTDMDFARLELSERLAGIEDDLPPNVRSVTVSPYVPDDFERQNAALLSYRFTGTYTQEALFQHLEEFVVPELSQVQGVSFVRASGGRNRVLEIRLDEQRLTSLGLTPQQVGSAISALDLVREAGAVRTGAQELTLTVVDRAESLQDVREAIVDDRNGDVVRVKDLGTVHDAFEPSRSYERIDGHPALRYSVYKEIGANAVQVADRVKARVEELQALNPPGSRMFLIETSDTSEDIRAQLLDLRLRALVSAVVIFAVLLLFLRSFRSAAMVFATIVFSVLIALNLIYFGGLSLNLLTLMGLAMGFGLIVDNSIVVLENVYRRWQGGEAPLIAAEHGAKEVVLPIIASTATTLIVFVPFVYLQGEQRLYYVPLAIVVVLTLVASLFVAFTFIPSLSAKMLTAGKRSAFRVPDVAPESLLSKKERERGEMLPSTAMMAGAPGSGLGDPGPGGVGGEVGDSAGRKRPPVYVRFYEALVGFNLRHPWLTVFITVGCLVGSGYLFTKYVTTGVRWGGGFGGQTRSVVRVSISLPRGSNLERTDMLTRFFEEKLDSIAEVEQYESSVSETRGNIQVFFPDSLEYTPIPLAIKDLMYSYSLGFTGVDVRVTGIGPSFYGGSSSSPNYSIDIRGYNYEKVREVAEALADRLVLQARIQDVNANSAGRYSRERVTEFVVEIDRQKLALHDLTVQDLMGRIGAFVRTDAGGSVKLGGDDLRLLVRTKDADDVDVLALEQALLPGARGGGSGVRLGDIVTISEREVLSTIHRENQQYHRTVAYEFRGPRKLGDLIRDSIVTQTVRTLPPGYTIEQSEGYSWRPEEKRDIYILLAVSIMLVFMVTAALFESLVQPLAVLLTVPMALIGVALTFFYAEATFTREAYIGVIMMGGIVVNNAILLVDHVNRVRRIPGLTFHQAILRGTLERVRPILMTTATTVLGLAPLVLFSQSADANIWNALGYALIGGLLSSTLFVLTTTPAVYLLFERGKVRKKARMAEYLASGADGGGGAAGAPGGSGDGIGGAGTDPEPQPA